MKVMHSLKLVLVSSKTGMKPNCSTPANILSQWKGTVGSTDLLEELLPGSQLRHLITDKELQSCV